MVLDSGKDGVEGTGIAAPKGQGGEAGIAGTASIEEITGANKISLDGVTMSDSQPIAGSHVSATQQGAPNSHTARLDIELAARNSQNQR